MIEVKKENVILKKTALGFENQGVLNLAVMNDASGIHSFYRAIAKENYSSIGYCKLSSPLIVEERLDVPIISPQCNYKTRGAEDPRITCLKEQIRRLSYLKQL